MSSVLRLEGLEAGYGRKRVLQGVSLEMESGLVYSLIGPNGCGKSTLLKTIAGLIDKISGDIYIEGKNTGEFNEAELSKKLAIVLTHSRSAEYMSCRQIVALGRYPHTGRLGFLGAEDEKKIDEALSLVGAEDIADRDFSRLSDGQRQRIMIARAICQEPKLLLLDEPTSFLDIRYRLDILRIIKRLAGEKNLAVLMSMHELEYAGQVSDKLVCIRDGRLDRIGSPEEVYTGDYIKELYGLEGEAFDNATGVARL